VVIHWQAGIQIALRKALQPADRGFTIAITPTADVPAPVTEVTVSGYVKADFIWDFDQANLGSTFSSGSRNDQRYQKDIGFSTHARQTRFRIRSRTDTAIGQIRTLIEGHFFGAGGSRDFTLRHAWGEWDMTPNWTLGIGRFWRLGYDVYTGVSLVDFGGSAGAPGASRTEQIRLTYASGPLTFNFGLQGPQYGAGGTQVQNNCNAGITTCTSGPDRRDYWNPTESRSRELANTSNLPSFGAHMTYDAPGGNQLFLGAEVQQNNIDVDATGWYWTGPLDANAIYGNKNKFGWVVSAGANVNLADIATLTGSISYSEGLVSRITGAGGDIWGLSTRTRVDGEPDVYTRSVRQAKAFGGYIGASFDMTDTVSFNTQFGFVDPKDSSMVGGGITYSHMYTGHANIMWQPVRQMRLGWEIMYAQKTNGKAYVNGISDGRGEVLNAGGDCGIAGGGYNDSCRKRKEDAWRAQFGAWFFF